MVHPADGVEPGEALAEGLTAHCRDKLAKYQIPRSFDFVPELPRDPSGKLWKRRLRDPYWEGQERAI